jgi:hypothetical protein
MRQASLTGAGELKSLAFLQPPVVTRQRRGGKLSRTARRRAPARKYRTVYRKGNGWIEEKSDDLAKAWPAVDHLEREAKETRSAWQEMSNYTGFQLRE